MDRGVGGVVENSETSETYSVFYHNLTDKDRALCERVLLDPRGWAGRGYRFVAAPDEASADIRVEMASNDTMKGMGFDGLSACQMTRPARIWLNRENWNHPPAVFKAPGILAGSSPGSPGERTDLYRSYLVNHEVGHALGYVHADRDAPGAPCSVMVQQTKGAGGDTCAPNPLPTVGTLPARIGMSGGVSGGAAPKPPRLRLDEQPDVLEYMKFRPSRPSRRSLVSLVHDVWVWSQLEQRRRELQREDGRRSSQERLIDNIHMLTDDIRQDLRGMYGW